MLSEHRFGNREELADAICDDIADRLKATLAQRERATLLLSGGSTPIPLYRRLSSATLDWDRVDVALVDERWVETDNDASNEKMLRQTLLTNRAAAARFVGLKNDGASAEAGVAECNRRYASLDWPATLCLLGMGVDGHTASLFPGAAGLRQALDRPRYCAAIRARPSAVSGDAIDRMTLTAWAIRQSEKLVLMITGAEKWALYERVKSLPASMELPIGLFIRQHEVPMDVFWAP